MVPSMFSLDHRLAELRPSTDELRLARQIRDAAEADADPAATRRSAVAARPGRVGERSARLATN